MRINLRAVTVPILLLLCGCHGSSERDDGTWVVSVGESYLTEEELRSALPVGLHGEDSVAFAENYVQDWVEDILLYRQAQENLPDDEEIDRRVEAYRRALTIHSYQEQLVDQEVGRKVTDAEVEAYYREHTEEFTATEPFLRGIYMKVPLNAPSLRTLRGWLRDTPAAHLDRLEKYGISHAVDYECFLQKWYPLSGFSVRMPEIRGRALRKGTDIEVTDSLYRYFLHVEELLPVGAVLPQEYASDEIREILTNLKRTDYISRMKSELLREATEDKRIKYYRK